MRNAPASRASRFGDLLSSSATPFVAARFAPQTVLFRQGDPCDSVMHIETGRVRLEVISPDGDKAVCGLMGAGAFLGDEGLTGRATRRHTATAISLTNVLVVTKADMIRALHSDQVISDCFMAHAITHGAHLEANLADQLLHSCAERLARTLLVLADCDGGAPCRCPVPRVSQEVVAEMVGTTRSHVNALLGSFKRREMIEEHGGTLYLSPTLCEWVEDAEARVTRDVAGADVSAFDRP